MRKLLVVGDVHAVPKELEECAKLIDFVIETAKQEQVEEILFLGDIFDTHAVIRIEVLNFWKEQFSRMKLEHKLSVACIVGNHDMPGSKQAEEAKLNSISTLSWWGVEIFDEPKVIYGNIGVIPYTHDKNKFVKQCKELYEQGVKETLFAHQTFLGAMFETNFPAPDGVSIGLVPQNFVISGHIHKRQLIENKVYYLGSPRWRKKSDANEEKYITVFTFDEQGKMTEQKDFDTSIVCRKIVEDTYSQSEAMSSFAEPPRFDPKNRNFLTLIGPARWVNKEKRQWEGIAEIRTKITNDKRSKNRVRESEGVESGMRRFIFENFDPAPGVTKEEIWKNLKISI